jgi:SAM-dependent methyltransferase
VLEVGCGTGAFLDLVRDRGGDATGIELNASAVEIGRKKGRRVAVRDVCTLAADEPESYDFVCHFQVLEHVSEPHRFLAACVRLLRPGGRLCIGVPNNDGYLGLLTRDAALLNQPPHHATRWGARTLNYLTQLFQIKLYRMAFEPLSRIHVPEYVAAQLTSWSGLGKPVGSAGYQTALILLRTVGLRRLVRGHTVYVSYTKWATN